MPNGPFPPLCFQFNDQEVYIASQLSRSGVVYCLGGHHKTVARVDVFCISTVSILVHTRYKKDVIFLSHHRGRQMKLQPLFGFGFGRNTRGDSDDRSNRLQTRRLT